MSQNTSSDTFIEKEVRSIGDRGQNRLKARWYYMAGKPDEAVFSCYKEDDGSLRVEITFPSE